MIVKEPSAGGICPTKAQCYQLNEPTPDTCLTLLHKIETVR